jgi:hypothetical protein
MAFIEDVDEFIRRFLIHVLPDGFHRIRHYGVLANGNRTSSIALARQLLGMFPRGSEFSGRGRAETASVWLVARGCL